MGGSRGVRAFDPAALVRLRKARGLSHDALSALTGWARPNIIRWEKGQLRPSPATLGLLAEALGVKPLQLTTVNLRTAHLVDLRGLVGLTQQQVAQELGLERSTYGLVERGVLALQPGVAERLATVFGVSAREVQRAYQRGVPSPPDAPPVNPAPVGPAKGQRLRSSAG